jgi:hypothetical protein
MAGKDGAKFLKDLKLLEDAAMANDDAWTLRELWGIVKSHDPDTETKKGLAGNS